MSETQTETGNSTEKKDGIRKLNKFLRSILDEAFKGSHGLALRGLHQSTTRTEYKKKDTEIPMIREEHLVSDLSGSWKVLRFYPYADREKLQLDIEPNMPVVVDVEQLNGNGEIFGTINEVEW